MEFLVIVLFVVAIVAVNFVISRAQRRKKQTDGGSPASGESRQAPAAKPQRPARNGKSAVKPVQGAPRTSVEAAREANSRLDAAQHQQVYAAIAQGHPVKAVKLYAQFTGVGVRAAGAAVENLAMHPQPFEAPRPPAPAAGAPAADAPAAGVAGTAAAGSVPAAPEPGDSADSPIPDKQAAADKPVVSDKPAAAETPVVSDEPAVPEQDAAARDQVAKDPAAKDPAGKDPADSVKKPGQGSTAKPATTPEEDEISQWVKNLRPEDF